MNTPTKTSEWYELLDVCNKQEQELLASNNKVISLTEELSRSQAQVAQMRVALEEIKARCIIHFNDSRFSWIVGIIDEALSTPPPPVVSKADYDKVVAELAAAKAIKMGLCGLSTEETYQAIQEWNGLRGYMPTIIAERDELKSQLATEETQYQAKVQELIQQMNKTDASEADATELALRISNLKTFNSLFETWAGSAAANIAIKAHEARIRGDVEPNKNQPPNC